MSELTAVEIGGKLYRADDMVSTDAVNIALGMTGKAVRSLVQDGLILGDRPGPFKHWRVLASEVPKIPGLIEAQRQARATHLAAKGLGVARKEQERLERMERMLTKIMAKMRIEV